MLSNDFIFTYLGLSAVTAISLQQAARPGADQGKHGAKRRSARANLIEIISGCVLQNWKNFQSNGKLQKSTTSNVIPCHSMSFHVFPPPHVAWGPLVSSKSPWVHGVVAKCFCPLGCDKARSQVIDVLLGAEWQWWWFSPLGGLVGWVFKVSEVQHINLFKPFWLIGVFHLQLVHGMKFSPNKPWEMREGGTPLQTCDSNAKFDLQ